MNVVLLRLASGPAARTRTLSPEMAVDILWATAVPDDRLEHIRARYGPTPEHIAVAMFLHEDATGPPPMDTALGLCHRAISTSQTFLGWTAEPLVDPLETTPYQHWKTP